MSPHAYCREKAARPGSTLYYSALFTREDARRGIVAVSAFCREITDVTAEPKEAGVARTKLAWWRSEVAAIYHGTPHHPVALALAEFRSAVDHATLDEMIAGAEMDLDYNAYPDFDALLVRCRTVSGNLAKLWARVCGVSDVRTLDATTTLGIAWQLTNIIRNVGRDARRNRIYLPLHDLAQHAVTSDDVAHARETENFRELIAFEIERNERLYADALEALPNTDRKKQRPLLAASAINRALLREIRSDGCHVLSARTSLTPLRKLRLAWRGPF